MRLEPAFTLHFNPPIPCGMGHTFAEACPTLFVFQSTHPVWDGTHTTSLVSFMAGFQSTHPVWDGTLMWQNMALPRIQFQSTHPVWDGTMEILFANLSTTFQSTHPVWDGTTSSPCSPERWCHFNPPIPCGMGPRGKLCPRCCICISIHPSRVGWDICRQP